MTQLDIYRGQEFSDDELIHLLKNDDNNREALGILYTKHKDYCFKFMKSMYKDIDEINDIYHDAIVTFNEKINKPDFSLTCKIQTYLNSICRNQILKKYNHIKRYNVRNADENYDFLESIEDTLEEIDDVNNIRINIMDKILTEWKEAKNKCYKLLNLFWYKNHSFDEIARIMNFKNSTSAKVQKYKCQKTLEIQTKNKLKVINDN
jgi:RNA polymerase sigma factor (sigma-70 family)